MLSLLIELYQTNYVHTKAATEAEVGENSKDLDKINL
jgi:hypothetical protein